MTQKEDKKLDLKDYRGERVVFLKSKWKEKSKIHPELENKVFLDNLEKAIEEPNFVWEDKSDSKNKRCYYWKYSTSTYIKVVIWISSNPCRVVTAFETNRIKEEKYIGEIKRLR